MIERLDRYSAGMTRSAIGSCGWHDLRQDAVLHGRHARRLHRRSEPIEARMSTMS